MTDNKKPLQWELFTHEEQQFFIQTLNSSCDGLTEPITTDTPIFLLRKVKPETGEIFFIIEVHQTNGTVKLLFDT